MPDLPNLAQERISFLQARIWDAAGKTDIMPYLDEIAWWEKLEASSD